MNNQFEKGNIPWNKGLPKELQPNFGKHRIFSNKTKLKMSLSKKGKKVSEEHRKNIILALRNRKHKEKKKISCLKCNNIFEDYPSSKKIFCSKKCLLDYKKDKGYEDRFGIEKANKIRKKMSNTHKERFIKNPSLKEISRLNLKKRIIDGKIKLFKKGEIPWNNGLKGKGIIKSNKKGKTFEEYYGKERANEIKKKMIGRKLSDEAKLNLSKSHKEYYRLNPISLETRKKMSERMKGKVGYNKGKKIKKSDEWIKNNIDSIKRFYQTEKGIKRRKEIGNRIKISRAKQILPIKDTSIEIKLQNFLKDLNIEFYPHQYIKEIEHGYQCDIWIPSLNLILEADGDYWHNFPFGRDIDHIRTKELQEKGFKVLRFWERDIKKMDLISFKDKISGEGEK